MEAVDTHIKDLNTLFDEFSVGIVDLIAYSSSSKGSPVVGLINEHLSIREMCFSVSRWRNATAGSVPYRPNNATSRINFVSRSIATGSQDHSLLILTPVSSMAIRFDYASGGLRQILDS